MLRLRLDVADVRRGQVARLAHLEARQDRSLPQVVVNLQLDS